MVRHKLYGIIILTLFTSCEIIGKRYLQDEMTQVPTNNKIFNRKNRNLPKEIDTNYIYDLVAVGYCDKNFERTRESPVLGAYYIQFYNNGAVRFMDYLEPNPEKSGNRGVFYIRNEKMFIDKFGLSSDRSGITYPYTLKVDGDYIYLRTFQKEFFSESSESLCFVYKKSDERISEEWQKYPSDW